MFLFTALLAQLLLLIIIIQEKLSNLKFKIWFHSKLQPVFLWSMSFIFAIMISLFLQLGGVWLFSVKEVLGIIIIGMSFLCLYISSVLKNNLIQIFLKLKIICGMIISSIILISIYISINPKIQIELIAGFTIFTLFLFLLLIYIISVWNEISWFHFFMYIAEMLLILIAFITICGANSMPGPGIALLCLISYAHCYSQRYYFVSIRKQFYQNIWCSYFINKSIWRLCLSCIIGILGLNCLVYMLWFWLNSFILCSLKISYMYGKFNITLILLTLLIFGYINWKDNFKIKICTIYFGLIFGCAWIIVITPDFSTFQINIDLLPDEILHFYYNDPYQKYFTNFNASKFSYKLYMPPSDEDQQLVILNDRAEAVRDRINILQEKEYERLMAIEREHGRWRRIVSSLEPSELRQWRHQLRALEHAIDYINLKKTHGSDKNLIMKIPLKQNNDFFMTLMPDPWNLKSKFSPGWEINKPRFRNYTENDAQLQIEIAKTYPPKPRYKFGIVDIDLSEQGKKVSDFMYSWGTYGRGRSAISRISAGPAIASILKFIGGIKQQLHRDAVGRWHRSNIYTPPISTGTSDNNFCCFASVLELEREIPIENWIAIWVILILMILILGLIYKFLIVYVIKNKLIKFIIKGIIILSVILFILHEILTDAVQILILWASLPQILDVYAEFMNSILHRLLTVTPIDEMESRFIMSTYVSIIEHNVAITNLMEYLTRVNNGHCLFIESHFLNLFTEFEKTGNTVIDFLNTRFYIQVWGKAETYTFISKFNHYFTAFHQFYSHHDFIYSMKILSVKV